MARYLDANGLRQLWNRIGAVFAKKTDLPDMSVYAKKSEVPNAPDLSGYATKDEVGDIEFDVETITETISTLAGKQDVIDLQDRADGVDTTLTELTQSVDSATSELPKKLDKPTQNPTAVGKVLKVQSVNADGTFVCEWASEQALPDVPVKGVKVAGTALTPDSDGNVNVPSGTGARAGVFKSATYYGTNYTDDLLTTYPADDSVISGRSNAWMPITPTHLNHAVKAALTDSNHLTMTDVEKRQCCDTIGAVRDKSFELIEEFTLASRQTWSRNAEPDGTPYNFEEVYVERLYPKDSSLDDSGMYGRLIMSDGTYTLGTENKRHSANNAVWTNLSWLNRNNGRTELAFTQSGQYNTERWWQIKPYPVGLNGSTLGGYSFSMGTIKSIYTHAYDSDAEGTIIKIYAIRA